MNKFNLFIICVLFGVATMNVRAQTWNCGYPNAANVTATLSSDGTLTISGTGDMRDYVYNTNPPPWSNVLASIITVNFTGNVTSIGNNAFRSCTELISVDIPGSVTKIGDQAFSSCSSLTSVTIPNSVASIGIRAFGNCTSLTSIDVAETNEYFCSENGILFNKDKTILIQYPFGKQGEFIIPNSVITLGDNAFSNFVALTSVTIPGSVTSIGNSAFSNCTGLLSVTISNGVKTIGEQAFWGCSSLSELSIGNTVDEIGDGAFGQCNLSLVVIPEGVKYIRGKAFVQASVTHLIIPSSVTEIEHDAFADNPLEEIWASWHEPAEVTVDFSCFLFIDKSSVILHVPVGTKAAYEAVDVWKDFNIVDDGLSFYFLLNLTVNVGELSPEFRSSTFSYRVTVPQSIESIQLTATPFDRDATVTGDGLKQLITGENTFEITVATPAGSRVYTVIVTRRTKDLHLDFIGSDEITTGALSVEHYNSIIGRNEWVPIIDKYEMDYMLTTGNYSGNLTLTFDIRGNTYSKEVSVQAYSSYRFTLSWRVGNYAPNDISFTTHFDAYGRPSYMTINYRRSSCHVTAFDNNDELSNESINMAGNSISNISVSGFSSGDVTTTYIGSSIVKVYPNPVKDELKIEGNGLTIKRVEIFCLSGKTVYQFNDLRNHINVSALSRGIYFMKIETEKGLITKKIVKE